jgi:hypothetical protein
LQFYLHERRKTHIPLPKDSPRLNRQRKFNSATSLLSPRNLVIAQSKSAVDKMSSSETCENLRVLVEDLKLKWQSCEDNSAEVFRYKLNVTKEKVLDGKFKFYVQVSSSSPDILDIRDVMKILIIAQ